MNVVKLLSAVTVAAGLSAGAAQAAPVTYTFTGTLDGTYYVYASGSGIVGNLFSHGDTFTLTAQFDSAQAPDYAHNNAPYYNQTQWYSGNQQTLSINGQTFSIGNSVAGYDDRYVENGLGGWGPSYDFMRMYAYDNTSGYGGGATSTLAGVSYMQSQWYLYNVNGSAGDLIDNVTPAFPTTVNLGDWSHQYFYFFLQGADGSYAQFYDSTMPVFTGLSSSASVQVPAPGALALLGLGLIGLGALRRSKLAA